LKDYLHFYLGQEAEGFWDAGNGIVESEGIGQLIGIDVEEKDTDRGPVCIYLPIRKHSSNRARRYFKFTEVAPILRPLSDINQEEVWEVAFLVLPGNIVRKREKYSIARMGHPEKHWMKKVHKSILCAQFEELIFDEWYLSFLLQFDSEDGSVTFLNYSDDGAELKESLCENEHELTRYLLSRGFDIFGLIESKLAIDKTQQQHKEGGV